MPSGNITRRNFTLPRTNSYASGSRSQTLLAPPLTVSTDPAQSGRLSRKMLREKEIVEAIQKDDLKALNTRRQGHHGWDEEIANRADAENTDTIVSDEFSKHYKVQVKNTSGSRKRQILGQFANRVGVDVRSTIIKTNEIRDRIPFVKDKNTALESEINKLLRKTSRLLGCEITKADVPVKRTSEIDLEVTDPIKKFDDTTTNKKYCGNVTEKKDVSKTKFDIDALEQLLKQSLDLYNKKGIAVGAVAASAASNDIDIDKKTVTTDETNISNSAVKDKYVSEEKDDIAKNDNNNQEINGNCDRHYLTVNMYAQMNLGKLDTAIVPPKISSVVEKPLIPSNISGRESEYKEALEALKFVCAEQEELQEKYREECDNFGRLQTQKANITSILRNARIMSCGARFQSRTEEEDNDNDAGAQYAEEVKTANSEYGVFRRKMPADGYYARLLAKKGLQEDFELRKCFRAASECGGGRRMKSYYSNSGNMNASSTIPIEGANGQQFSLDLGEVAREMKIDERTRIYDRYNLLNTTPNRMDPELMAGFINPKLRHAETNILKVMQDRIHPRSSAIF